LPPGGAVLAWAVTCSVKLLNLLRRTKNRFVDCPKPRYVNARCLYRKVKKINSVPSI
jgi:hypothetical protein